LQTISLSQYVTNEIEKHYNILNKISLNAVELTLLVQALYLNNILIYLYTFSNRLYIMKLIFKSLGTLPLRRFLSTVPKPLNPVQEAALEERCILVDEHDQECGFASKRDCHRLVNGKLPLHRAFSVFLFNTKDELLLQQRSSTKITFPGHYTNSCCSHPLYEIEHECKDIEGVKTTACRRLVFDLGIHTNQ